MERQVILPVAVLMKMYEPEPCGFEGSFKPPVADRTTQLHVIGYITDEMIEETKESFDAARMRLADKGLALSIYVSGAIKEPSSLGCAIFYAVEVRDMEAARSIPKFSQVTIWTGYEKITV